MDNQETEPMDLQEGADAIAGLMDDTLEDGIETPEGEPTDDTDPALEGEEDLDTEPKYKVKVNGEERLVALPDLIKGHMLHETTLAKPRN